ncbi:MAG: PEP-CTERM sorting domain-containing protein, partial [Gammaproteobacteria bacterium]|nr:PEP-CTERM sorting domain-containing protein [Gammaproteobacteria bacterium]
IILSDPTRTALTSNALPLDAPDLLDFASKEFQLSVWVQEKHTAIGSINTLKIVSVPEPSIIALISIGLVSIGFVRRRAKKYKHIIMEK